MFIDRYNLRKIMKILYSLVEQARASEDAEALIILAIATRQLDILEAKRYTEKVYPGCRGE